MNRRLTLNGDSVFNTDDSDHHSESRSFDIDVSELRKRYGSQSAVDGVSFRIEKGSVFGLIGPNGAGKSTTLKMLMRLIGITTGSAKVLGAKSRDEFQEIKHQIGYVPEVHNIYPWMTVRCTTEFVKAFYSNWDAHYCEKMIRQFDLDLGKKVKALSKGMVAKLALVLAISHRPKLLILDEPLSGLDPIVRDEFLDGVMQVICDGASTVIFSSHSIDEVQRVADSVGIMNRGKFLANESVERLAAKVKVLSAVVGEDSRAHRWLPNSALRQRREGREWKVTVRDFSPALLHQFECKNGVGKVDVHDLSLSEIFKEFIYADKSDEEPSAERLGCKS